MTPLSRRPARTRVTPFPAALIDEVMPILKDTEWRILCVVVRQTLGWQVDEKTKRRKEADWLTQSQLKSRTGRASEALSKALDQLVRGSWIEICDTEGQLLSTPAQRRCYRGRAFFRLGQRAQAYLTPQQGGSMAEGEPTCSQEPTSSQAGTYSQSEVQLPQSEQECSQSEFRKANITKETYTKIIPYGREYPDPLIHRQSVDNPLLHEINQLEINQNKRNKTESQIRIRTKLGHQANPDVQGFIQSYIMLFKQQTVNGEPPVVSWGKDGKIIKQLLELYPYPRLVELLHQFFASKDTWVRQSGYSVGAFRATVNKLLAQENTPSSHRTSNSSIRSGQWSRGGW